MADYNPSLLVTLILVSLRNPNISLAVYAGGMEILEAFTNLSVLTKLNAALFNGGFLCVDPSVMQTATM